jgi:hypothetical protein
MPGSPGARSVALIGARRPRHSLVVCPVPVLQWHLDKLFGELSVITFPNR